jgi:hypothetical protein
MIYQNTMLEDYIYKMYQSLGIHDSKNIHMIELADKLGISLFYSEEVSFSYQDSIVLRRSTKEMEWEAFGHELAHILIHVGNQLKMPEDFIFYQESKASNFAFHFCVPTFMLQKMSLPFSRREALFKVMESFNVTFPFAKKRLEHYENQLIGNMIQEKWTEYVSNKENSTW